MSAEPKIGQIRPDHVGEGGWLYADEYGDVYRLLPTGRPGDPLTILRTGDTVCRACGGYGKHVDEGGCRACGDVQPGPV